MYGTALREKEEKNRRLAELVAALGALRGERSDLQEEVSAVRRELERRGGSDESVGGELEAALTKEVDLLLARHAELATHLERARREKAALEGDLNEALKTPRARTPLATSDAEEEEEEEARGYRVASAAPGEDSTQGDDASTSAPAASAAAADDDDDDDEPVRRTSTGSPSPSSFASPSAPGSSGGNGNGKVRRRRPMMEEPAGPDGPDAELAAHLIGRLKRAGESDEAAVLTAQVDALIRRVLLTLVPIRRRSRGERRSLRTSPARVSLRPGSLAFNSLRASTPFNSI